MLTYAFQANLFLAAAAKPNSPGLRRIQPEQQLHQGALAAAAGANDGDLLAWGDAQIKLVKHRFFVIGKGQPTDFDAHGVAAFERIDAPGVLRLVLARQQLVDSRQRATGGVEGILQAKQLLDRADHKPQVTEYREHLTDRQIREQHGEHGRRAEHVDTELEQQTAGAVRGIGLPLRGHGVVAHFLGTTTEATEEEALAVAGTDFLNRFEGFG